MTFTGLTLHYAQHDLNAHLPARVQKIQQLSKGQLLFHMKGKKAFKWYIDITPQHARTHRTTLSFSHKEGLSSLAQRMKKWFINAQITRVQQHGTDRVLTAEIHGSDDLFDAKTYHLILEFFGKDANLIITDETGEILDLYRPSGSVFNHPRAVHIGAFYTWPPKTKASPFDETAVAEYFNDLTRAPHHVFEGFSKALGESLMAVAPTKNAWFEALAHPKFSVVDGRFTLFEGDDSMAFVDWADARLRQIFEETPYNLTLKNLQKTLEKKRAKALKKIGVLTQELGEVSRADDFIRRGQLLMQSPDKHAKKASVTVQDYATGETLTLKLDAKKTVLAHANDAFKKAKKIKQSVPHLNRQIKQAKQQSDYLESIIDQLYYADANAFYAIQDELAQAKIIRPPKRKGKSPKAKPKVYEWEGILIYVGQNHQQNAELTHRFAKRSWRFLHARSAPGAHVIVADDDPSNAVLEKAAMLAAYHSKLRHSPKAEVDSVLVKDVRTLKGKPGSMVTYDRYDTFVVTGDHPDIPIKKSA